MHFFVISLRIYKKKKNKFTKKAERERDFKGVADRENKLSRCVPIIFPFLGGSWAGAVSQGSSVLSVFTWDVRSLKLFTIECYPVPALYMSAPFSVIRSASSLFILATQSSTEFSSTQPTSTSKLLFRAVSFTYIIKSVHLFFSAALSTHHRKLI